MADAETARGPGLRPAYVAMRTQAGLIAALFALAALGWWWTAREMRGMDNGPWTGLGGLGWFVGIWVVMMAAMMFPSVSPTVALYARMCGRRPLAWSFTMGYLTTWAGAGVVAFVIGAAAQHVGHDFLAWGNAGRPLAGVTLLVAAVYELTPLKNVCLGKCRSPLGTLLRSWRVGWSGAYRMGLRNGGWCVGCCWALMASLFALGVMSVTWTVVVAGLIAFEKLVPWRRVAVVGTTLILGSLGLLMLVAPGWLPGLQSPADDPMPMMSSASGT